MSDADDRTHHGKAARRVYMGSQALRTLAALFVVVTGLKLGSEFLVPLLLAAFFALALSPIAVKLRGAGAPSWLALAAAFAAAGAVVFGLAALIGGSIPDLQAKLPDYEDRIASMADDVAGYLIDAGISVPASAADIGVNPEALLSFVTGVVQGVGGTLSNAIVVLLVMVFMMSEALAAPDRLTPTNVDGGAGASPAQRIARSVTDYLSVKTLVSVGTGITWGVFLAIIGVDFPVLWGLVAFLFNYVPNVGSVIAAIPPILLALVQFGFGHALMAIGGTVVINGFFGNVLEPRMMGQKLGLSALVVFVGLIFWSWVFGPVGALLSVPLTIVVKLALEMTDDYTDLAGMMGPASQAAPD